MKMKSQFANPMSPALQVAPLMIQSARRAARSKTMLLKRTVMAPMWAMLLLAACGVTARSQDRATDNQRAAKGLTTQASGANLPVLGSGTTGQLTKWTGNSYIGDSIITETKSGQVGIGTIAPTSKLTVAGAIESTTGGLKFPDGTVQTTAFNQTSSPGLQPFQQTLSAAFGAGLSFTNASLSVPTGKRLVIETVSLHVELLAGQSVVSVILGTTVSGQLVDFSVFPVSTPSGGANLSDYGITQPLKIYADPGTQITATLLRSDTAGFGSPIGFTLAISGYLLDAQ